MSERKKLQKVYDKINKSWVLAQEKKERGEKFNERLVERPFRVIEFIYHEIKDLDDLPGRLKMADYTGEKLGHRMGALAVKAVMEELRDEFNLKAKDYSRTTREGVPQKRKQKKRDLSFNRKINEIFGGAKCTQI